MSVGDVHRPGIVHRLDKETSGVMVVAESDRAHADLSAQFKNRSVKKTYLAFCESARKKVLDNFTYDLVSKKYTDLYREVLSLK